MRNSWGRAWGSRGRAWMTWDDLGQLLADDGDCTILVPRTEPAPQPAAGAAEACAAEGGRRPRRSLRALDEDERGASLHARACRRLDGSFQGVSMGAVSAKLRRWTNPNNGDAGYMYWCQGCGELHQVITEGGKPNQHWAFNGDLERPTFTPSVLTQYDRWEPPVTAENRAQWREKPWRSRGTSFATRSLRTAWCSSLATARMRWPARRNRCRTCPITSRSDP
jgi:hypothetical protein